MLLRGSVRTGKRTESEERGQSAEGRREQEEKGDGGVVAEVEDDAGYGGAGAGAGEGEHHSHQTEQQHLEEARPELGKVDGAEEQAAAEHGRGDAPEPLQHTVDVAAEDDFLNQRSQEQAGGDDEEGGSAAGEEAVERERFGRRDDEVEEIDEQGQEDAGRERLHRVPPGE